MGRGDAIGTAFHLVMDRGLLRDRDLEEAGISHGSLPYMEGLLERMEPGIIGEFEGCGDYSAAVRASAKWPNAVILGLSALHLWGLCDEPAEVWLGVGPKARAPRPRPEFPMVVLRCRGLPGDSDVQQLEVLKVKVALFSRARALLDCLRFIERMPMDLVRSALTNALLTGAVSREELCTLARRKRCLPVVQGAMTVLAPSP